MARSLKEFVKLFLPPVVLKLKHRIMHPGKPAPPAGLSIGKNTEIKGGIYFRKPGGTITIGDECLIEGSIGTETETTAINIGNNVYIGHSNIVSAKRIDIEDDVLISSGCLIQDSDNHNLRYSIRKNDCKNWKANETLNWELSLKEPIRICKGAWIGAKSIILKGVVIGEGAVVGAGSVVTKSVEPYTVVAGNPAKFIRKIED